MIAKFACNKRVFRKCIPMLAAFTEPVLVPENEDIIPYTVWGNDTKVVLRVPTELKYYDGSVDLRPIKTVQTAWVSYSFEDEHGKLRARVSV